MKTAVIGYSGSGKSTLAAKLAQQQGLTALHMDTVFWLPGWKERDRAEMRCIVDAYLTAHDNWVIDGNYSKILFERRMEEADRIILMQFSPLACLWRAWKRYRRYKGSSRKSMAAGCPEKMDAEFVRWLLWKGRTKKSRDLLRDVRERYLQKTVWIRNQRQLDQFEKECGLCLI